MADSITEQDRIVIPANKRLAVRRRGRLLFYVESGEVDLRRLPKDAEHELVDAPVLSQPPVSEINGFDDLTRAERLWGLLETLTETQKDKIVQAVKDRREQM